jgi:hypothetical protein
VRFKPMLYNGNKAQYGVNTMSDAITQQYLLSSRNYTIEYNGVRVLEKGLNKQFSYFVPFEEVPSTPFSLRLYV